MSTCWAPEYIVPPAPAALAEILEVVAPKRLAAVPAGKSACGAKPQLSTFLEGDAADAVLGPDAANEAEILEPVHKLLGRLQIPESKESGRLDGDGSRMRRVLILFASGNSCR